MGSGVDAASPDLPCRGEQVFLVYTVLASAMLVLSLLLLFWLTARSAAVLPPLRLKESGVEPRLSLATGKKWHVFLSHVWATGQASIVSREEGCREARLLKGAAELCPGRSR